MDAMNIYVQAGNDEKEGSGGAVAGAFLIDTHPIRNRYNFMILKDWVHV